MKTKLSLAVLMLSMMLMGCTTSERAQIESLGSRHRITLYGYDGKVIRQWVSTGRVANETQSDGWYFRDEATGKLVEVTGTIVIEQL
jgi:uncharacterized lipoprotein YehR (DUF1307 family)